MQDINVVCLTGRLTKDSEIRSFPDGGSIVNFSIAVNKPNRKINDKWEQQAPHFFNCSWSGGLAASCKQYLNKGIKVSVQGILNHRTWTTQDGQKRSMVEVRCENVQILQAKSHDPQEVAGPQEATAPDPEPPTQETYGQPGPDEDSPW